MEINKSLIIPCKNEGKEIIPIINKFIEHTKEDTSIYVVLDSKNDKTFAILNNKSLKINLLINNEGSGVASAINFGIKNSLGNYVCIAMGDGSDDPTQVEDLFNLVERGLSIAVASRYSRGGQYIGTKNLKYFLSKYSGRFLNLFFRIETKDPTNMFKAYSRDFLNSVEIESANGFTLGLEMVVKAKLNNFKIGEIPTIWIDRMFGESKFNLKKFIPGYLYWVRVLILKR